MKKIGPYIVAGMMLISQSSSRKISTAEKEIQKAVQKTVVAVSKDPLKTMAQDAKNIVVKPRFKSKKDSIAYTQDSIKIVDQWQKKLDKVNDDWEDNNDKIIDYWQNRVSILREHTEKEIEKMNEDQSRAQELVMAKRDRLQENLWNANQNKLKNLRQKHCAK